MNRHIESERKQLIQNQIGIFILDFVKSHFETLILLEASPSHMQH